MPDVAPARAAALDALSSWRGADAVGERGGPGGRAEDVLDQVCARMKLERRDRALAQEILYGTIRNLIRIDHVLSHFIKRKFAEVAPVLRDVLRIAAYQIMFLDRVPDHAVVYDAVEQAKSAQGRGAASFVNGVLRNMIRRGSEVDYPDAGSDPSGHLSLKYSYPAWLVRRWLARFGPDEASALMEAGNAVPPLVIRANTLRTARPELAAIMREVGIDVSETRYAPDGLVVPHGHAVQQLPGYEDGLFAVQDEAAQLVSLLLGPGTGELILDACAAPGGKASHICALSGGGARVLAADIGLDKTRTMKENIARLGAGCAHAAVMDSAAGLPVKVRFDRVLLDAPCSALGIIRRRPEIKYTRREADIDRLSCLQSSMLANVAGVLKSGGTLVFSTCTTEPEEGELVVERFLAENGEFSLEDSAGFFPPAANTMVTPEGFMRSFPHIHGTDGFFAARLRRN